MCVSFGKVAGAIPCKLFPLGGPTHRKSSFVHPTRAICTILSSLFFMFHDVRIALLVLFAP